MGQGIIATTPTTLKTVPASGATVPPGISPKLGINVDPLANLDVEAIPEPGLPSNLRFRNLPASKDTMFLVRDAGGYVKWRGLSSFASATSGGAWLLIGNSTVGAEFIGTLTPDDMRFRSNNVQRMRLLQNGSLTVEYSGLPNSADDQANLLVGHSNVLRTGHSNTVSGWVNQLTNASANLVAGSSNIVASPSGGSVSKSIALGWANQVRNHNQYLIGADNHADDEYSGALGVGLRLRQRGAWYLGGNSGTNLTNNLTNSLAIGWNNQHTALFDVNGLSLGTATGNITNPGDNATARIDVEAAPFNFFPSGVRFRNLPYGRGEILVVDPAGYVYKATQMASKTDHAAELEELKAQVAELQAQVKMLMAARSQAGTGKNQLDIIPTPFTERTRMIYALENFTGKALLQITDMSGKIIKTLPLTQAGGQVEINQLPPAAGQLIFSIYNNGQLAISRQSVKM